MALRAKPPTDRMGRLKCMIYGPAGEGKTTAAIQMPRPYIIDTEGGCCHYSTTINSVGGAVFESNDIEDVIVEVRELAKGGHDYRTIVIDPFTPLYDVKTDEGADKVGTDFGRHYGYANTFCKRLFNVLSVIDMNVVVTCHAKREYGDGMQVIGQTFDGWRKLDYAFDLVFELKRVGAKRMAYVRKTRLEQFSDQSSFEWSFDALASRYGGDLMTRQVEGVDFAGEAQVQELRTLLANAPSDMGEWLSGCLRKAKVDCIENLQTEQIGKMIDYLKNGAS